MLIKRFSYCSYSRALIFTHFLLVYSHLGVTIAGMSISRHLDQYLSERGLVQRAEVVPEDGCQEFLPADRWFGDMPEGEMVENDTPQKDFFDESTGDVIDQARSMIEDLFRS